MISSLFTCVRAAALAVGAVVGFGISGASAATVTDSSVSLTTGDVGFSWTVQFDCTSSPDCAGQSQEVVFTMTSVTTGASSVQWGFEAVISNTSSTNTGFVTSVGFNTDPNATVGGVSNYSGGTDSYLASDWEAGAGSVPSVNTELCVWIGNSCTATGSDHTMTPGTEDKVSFVVTTQGTGTSLTFDNYGIKVQGVAPTGGSFEYGGTVQVAPVPLPAAMPLLLVGLGALGAVARRRSKPAA